MACYGKGQADGCDGVCVKGQADEDTAEARKLADQYQPIIIEAEKDKRDSDFHFQQFAQATNEVCPRH